MSDALEVIELTKEFSGPLSFFGRRAAPRRAVQSLTLRVQTGEVYGFLGKNGAGKTTTIKMILNLLQPTTGDIRVFGESASDPKVRKRIGFVPESAAFYDYLTAYETLHFLGGLSGLKGPGFEAKIREALQMVSLAEEENSFVRTFSKGMKQRLGIAQSLLDDPELLIFDEPTTGLDPFGRSFFKKLVQNLKSKGKTVFFSSHQLLDVQEICDRVGVIHFGKLVYEGPVKEFLAGSTSLEERFVELIARLDSAEGRQTKID